MRLRANIERRPDAGGVIRVDRLLVTFADVANAICSPLVIWRTSNTPGPDAAAKGIPE
jgi:hypothetical protein